jgi:hypothetical protein
MKIPAMVLPFLVLIVACGGGPASPTLIEAPGTPDGAGSVHLASVRPMPQGLDPTYVLALSSATPDGRPKVWAGGPMHHCFGEGIDPQVLEPVIQEMSALSGVPRTDAGPCNVEWIFSDEIPEPAEAQTQLGGTPNAIYSARVQFHRPIPLFDQNYIVKKRGRHEGGHVLGLSHSPIDTDAMAIYGAGPYSASERAVMGWMYR